MSEATVTVYSEFEPMEYVTFNTEALENRVKMFNARNNARSLTEIGNDPIQVEDVMSEIGVRSRSGLPCQNTYLFLTNGDIYLTQSNGIARTVNELVEMLNGDIKANSTNGFVEVQVQEAALSGDRTYKQLKLLAV